MTNSMKSRARSCIALGPTGILQSSIKYFNLIKGTILVHRRIIEELPLPDSIIKRTEKWGLDKKKSKTPTENHLEILNRKELPFGWEDATSDFSEQPVTVTD